MSKTIGLKLLLISMLAGAFFHASLAFDECTAYSFKCLNGKCISRRDFCDGRDDCKDNSDERYCGREIQLPCPDGWVRCPNRDRCIPSYFVCDGYRDCYGGESEEKNCTQEPCSITGFKCPNGTCINRVWVCNGRTDCGNNTDEQYCDLDPFLQCPTGYIRCPSSNRCIFSHWKCDGIVDCRGRPNEERYCGNYTAKRYFNIAVKDSSTTAETSTATTGSPSTAVETSSIAAETSRIDGEMSSNTAEEMPDITNAKIDLKSWLLQRRKSGSGADSWGSQIPRIAVALHLSDESTFGSDNNIGKEIRYELTLQLLYRLAKDKKISSQELALYIHALLVACMDPRDFYGEDLVQELRRRMEAGGNYTNPFLLLVLCNAGDAMTLKDLLKAAAAYTSQRRHFWTDYQSLAAMALSCISSSSSGIKVDEPRLNAMLQELKRRQLRNGIVENLKTTALVTQALFMNDSYKKDFDLDSAMKVLIDGLKGRMSILDVYYSLPVLNMKSLLNVTSGHCRKKPIAEEEALQKALDVNKETVTVHYSVWMGDEINVGRTWILKVRVNSTIYNALETVGKIDNRQKVEYNFVDGKPYVTAMDGKEDDPEMEMFWYVYLKTLSSDKDPKIVEQSPVDVKLHPNQEIILWYKHGPWNDENFIQKPATSP